MSCALSWRYTHRMKRQPFFRKEDQAPTAASPLPSKKFTSDHQIGFSSDEVSKAAYYIYLHQGSQPGYELQHWEEAKKQLQARQNISRTAVVL